MVTATTGIWRLPLFGRRLSLGRSGTLLVSRIYEQAVLGLASIALAWRLGVTAFAPVSALLVINSFCVVASDLGLGTDLISRASRSLSLKALQRQRQLTGAVVLWAVVIGIVFARGDTRIVIIGAGLLWASSGEAFIRKSALLKLGMPGRAAISELIGSSLLAVGVSAALLWPHNGLELVALALVVKHVTEAMLSYGWESLFEPLGASAWNLAVWSSSLLSFMIANIDFIIVAVIISGEAFSIYSLGFRLAAVFVAQVGYVVNRTSLVDFGESHREGGLAQRYRDRRRQMFGIGIIAGIVTATIAPLVPLLLQDEWKGVIGVTIVLSIVVPWRLCSGLGVMMAIAVGHARRLTQWEAIRLLIAALAMIVAGQFGLAPFTATVGCVAILTAVGYDRVALKLAGLPGKSWMVWSIPIGATLIFAAVTLLPFLT